MAEIVPLNSPGLEPPPARPEPERDHYKRYLIPHPETGKELAWTRATTWAKTVKEETALNNWKVRMTAVGLSRRPDLLASVAAVNDPKSDTGKKRIAEVCEDAKEYAGSNVRSNLGKALHSFVETLDGGGKIETIPAPSDKDIEAYYNKLSDLQIRLSENYIERICVLPQLGADPAHGVGGIAGTLDRVAEFNGKRMICDLKTGDDLGYSWPEIAIQLALYSRASTIYDPVTKKHHKMPAVDQQWGIVLHLPAGKATCDAFLVDIEAGWVGAQLCSVVRQWRKRKDLATPITQAEGA